MPLFLSMTERSTTPRAAVGNLMDTESPWSKVHEVWILVSKLYSVGLKIFFYLYSCGQTWDRPNKLVYVKFLKKTRTYAIWFGKY
jgi:hypothetical protein